MLENSEGCNKLRMERSERCTPDYEGMIKRLEEKLGKTIAFRDAVLGYFEGSSATGKMAELIGELVTKCNSLDREINSLIQAQIDRKE